MNYKKKELKMGNLFTNDIVDFEDYISPVTLSIAEVASEINKKRDEQIISNIETSIGVAVDKNELIKALQYDRDQYSKGYKAAYAERTCHVSEEGPISMIYAGVWYRCNNCNYINNTSHARFCGGCGRIIMR